MKEIVFENNTVNFGTVSKDQVLDFEFEFSGDPADVDYAFATCPACTDAWCEGNKVKGKFNVNYGMNANGQIMKNVKVFLDPDQPEFVADEQKRRVRNDLKREIVLNLRGKVNDVNLTKK